MVKSGTRLFHKFIFECIEIHLGNYFRSKRPYYRRSIQIISQFLSTDARNYAANVRFHDFCHIKNGSSLISHHFPLICNQLNCDFFPFILFQFICFKQVVNWNIYMDSIFCMGFVRKSFVLQKKRKKAGYIEW